MPIHVTYIVMFLGPATFFFGLMAFLVGRGLNNIESRIFFVACLMYCYANIMEFIRHIVDVAYSPIFTVFGVSLPMTIGTCTILHLMIILLKKSLNKRIHHKELFVYVPALFPILSVFIPYFQLHASDYYWEGIWLYKDQQAYIVLIYLVNLVPTIVAGVLLVIGLVKSEHMFYRKHFLLYLQAALVIAALICALIFLGQSLSLPPSPTLLIGLFICGVIIVSMYKYNISLSIGERYRRLLTLTPFAVIILNDMHQIVEANTKAVAFFPNKDATTFDEMFVSERNKKAGMGILRKLMKYKKLKSEIVSFANTKWNEEQYYEFEGDMFHVESERYYFIIWRNVTKEHVQSKRIKDLAYIDPLTNLHNRTYFVPFVRERLALGEQAYLILSDLNFFKEINDTHGHAVGDAVLKHTAMLFKKGSGINVIVARLGGDEFLLYVPIKTVEDKLIVEKLRKMFVENPYTIDDINITVSPSFGVVHVPSDGDNFEELYHLADLRMYKDKEQVKAAIRQSIGDNV